MKRKEFLKLDIEAQSHYIYEAEDFEKQGGRMPGISATTAKRLYDDLHLTKNKKPVVTEEPVVTEKTINFEITDFKSFGQYKKFKALYEKNQSLDFINTAIQSTALSNGYNLDKITEEQLIECFESYKQHRKKLNKSMEEHIKAIDAIDEQQSYKNKRKLLIKITLKAAKEHKQTNRTNLNQIDDENKITELWQLLKTEVKRRVNLYRSYAITTEYAPHNGEAWLDINNKFRIWILEEKAGQGITEDGYIFRFEIFDNYDFINIKEIEYIKNNNIQNILNEIINEVFISIATPKYFYTVHKVSDFYMLNATTSESPAVHGKCPGVSALSSNRPYINGSHGHNFKMKLSNLKELDEIFEGFSVLVERDTLNLRDIVTNSKWYNEPQEIKEDKTLKEQNNKLEIIKDIKKYKEQNQMSLFDFQENESEEVGEMNKVKLTDREIKIREHALQQLNEIVKYQKIKPKIIFKKLRKDNTKAINGRTTARFNAKKSCYEIIVYEKYEQSKTKRTAVLLHEIVHVLQCIELIQTHKLKIDDRAAYELPAIYIKQMYLDVLTERNYLHTLDYCSKAINNYKVKKSTAQCYEELAKTENKMLLIEVITNIVPLKQKIKLDYIDVLVSGGE